ncbi:ABC transporter permease [Mesorhizobium sp. BAC0120]|uniref:ABC transporter permease n=1 Tax=Mesorhizobium sp. BAC0120 TaxID=3090670 RepID=UPI00298D3251|nr:ABC transporter permease [Mesorhizobium sp. BAC0120]MDW6023568.1 ABC transporter permease [Mesorhizobium sp. BAC0120]
MSAETPAGGASRSFGRRSGHIASYLMRRSPVAVTLVTIFILAAIFGPWLTPHSMTDTNLGEALQLPSLTYWLGTDPLGRDVLSRLLGSARVAAQAFLIVVLIGGIFGTLLGLVAGGLGGLIDLVISRVIEILQGFPTVLVAIVIVALLNPSLTNAMIAVGLAAIPDFARVSRGVAIQLRDREFVEAARGLGASEIRILLHEVLPNMVGPLIIVASFDGAQAIMWEAALSFLGLGVQPPAPSFGSMLREAQNYLAIQPSLAITVGITVSAIILGLNLLGDGLSDYYDSDGR